MAVKGFSDLDRAREWLEQVLVDGHVDLVPSGNHCLFNLYTKVSAVKSLIRRIFISSSCHDYAATILKIPQNLRRSQRSLVDAPLNVFMQEQKGYLLRN